MALPERVIVSFLLLVEEEEEEGVENKWGFSFDFVEEEEEEFILVSGGIVADVACGGCGCGGG
eukprot:11515127-Ditylum_brightwellii.AAC.1